MSKKSNGKIEVELVPLGEKLAPSFLNKEDLLALRALNSEVRAASAARAANEAMLRVSGMEEILAGERLKAFAADIDARLGTNLAGTDTVNLNDGKITKAVIPGPLPNLPDNLEPPSSAQ